MSFNEVPDSDVEVPPLIAESPVWISLGTPLKSTSSPTQADIETESRMSKPRNPQKLSKGKSINSRDAPELVSSLAADHSDQLPTGTPAQIINSKLHPVASKSINCPDSSNGSETNVPRRRRFDFKSWVENDKKIHEYVYQRRFQTYYGPVSDSEDEDYDIPEDGILDPSNVVREKSDDDMSELDSMSNSGTESHAEYEAEPTDGAINRPDSPLSENTSRLSRSRRKLRMVDSEDSDSESEGPLPLSKRRVTAAIPAEHSNNDSYPLDYFDEALEDRGGIDYMQPRRYKTTQKPSTNNKEQHSHSNKRAIAPRKRDVINFARVNGQDASRGLKVAARTARARQQKSVTQAPRFLSNTQKLFPNKNLQQGKHTLQPNKNSSSNPNLPQFFLDLNSEGMQNLPTNCQKKSTSSTIGASSDEITLKRKAMGQSNHNDVSVKQKRRNRGQTNQKTLNFRTTILEKELSTRADFLQNALVKQHHKPGDLRLSGVVPAQRFASATSFTSNSTSRLAEVTNIGENNKMKEHLALNRGYIDRCTPENSSLRSSRDIHNNHRRSGGSLSGKSSRSSTVNASVVHVNIKSPACHLNHSNFGVHTFVGSGLLNLFDGPGNWLLSHPKPIESGFGTPISDSTEQKVTDDCGLIISIHESLDPTIYVELYAYFLTGARHLCDEREIIELSYKKFVVREWLRLARALLKFTLRYLSATHYKSRHKNRTKSSQFYWVTMLTLLVTEASFVLSQHVGAYELSTLKKGKTLAIWVLFYLQDAVSSQIERIDPVKDEFSFVGAELLFTFQKFCGYAPTLAKLFTHVQTVEPYWHLLVLFASCFTEKSGTREIATAATSTTPSNWFDWEIVRELMKLTIHMDPYLVMLYIRRLLVYWRWPVSTDVISDLFDYFSKIGYYADPQGETLGLHSFLITSSFNGYDNHVEGFSLFLEILGFTIKTLKELSDKNVTIENVKPTVLMRRLASRVTPLSSLEFPESREVTLKDLSSASHQFGLLIVLKRLLPKEMRPTIAQFRDLVVLKGAHWAMRIKIISAWDFVVKIAASTNEKEECRLWMEEILSAEYLGEPVINFALETVLEHWEPLAVPKKRLVQVSLLSKFDATRLKAWKLLGMSNFDSQDILKLTKWQNNFTSKIDLPAIAHIIGNHGTNPGLIHEWISINCRNSNVRARSVYKSFAGNSVWRKNNFRIVAPYLISAVLEAEMTPEIIEFLVIVGLVNQSMSQSIEFLSTLTGRRKILRNLFMHISTSEDLCMTALNVADQQSRNLADQGSDKSAMLQTVYLPLVSDLRQLIQPVFPQLVLNTRSKMLIDEYSQSLETMQSNLLSLMDGKTNHSATYFYFAYCLRKLVTSDEIRVGYSNNSKGNYQGLNDTRFVSEVKIALHTANVSRNGCGILSTLLALYESFFTLTSLCISQQTRNCLPLILPTVVKSARLALGWDPSNSIVMGRFISCVALYIDQLTRSHRDMMRKPFTISLIKEFSKLGISWLNQSAGHYKDYYADIPLSQKPDLPLKPILDTVYCVLDVFTNWPPTISPDPKKSSLWQTSTYNSILQNTTLVKNLAATFDGYEIMKSGVIEQVDEGNLVELQEFCRFLKYFILAYEEIDL